MQAAGLNTLEVALHGRTFGKQRLENDVFDDVPESFRSLSIGLKQRSALFALQPVDGLTRDQVIDAFRTDLELIDEHVEALNTCVRLAILCSIRAHDPKKSHDYEDQRKMEEDVRRLWYELCQEIPPLGQQSLLRLDSDLAAKSAVQILEQLQHQFDASMRRIPQIFVCWLQLMAEKEMIGVVEWTDVDVGRYHYFKRERDEKELDRSKEDYLIDEDPSQPFGSRRTYRTIVNSTVRLRNFFERHVHHIVRGRIDNLEEYGQKVPCYVADLIEALPPLVRPMCEIVSGDIVHEEIVRRTDTKVYVVRDESVFKASPAVTIGGAFTLAGWSSDDMKKEDATRYYEGQKAKETFLKLESRQLRRSYVIGVLVLAAVAALLTPIVLWCIESQNAAVAAAQREYDNYQQTIPQGLRGHEVMQFQRLVLEGDTDPILFGNASRSSHSVTWSLTLQRGQKPEKPQYVAHYEVPYHDHVGAYGDVDLMPQLGVPATLHVIGIDKGRSMYDPVTLRYKITLRKD